MRPINDLELAELVLRYHLEHLEDFVRVDGRGEGGRMFSGVHGDYPDKWTISIEFTKE